MRVIRYGVWVKTVPKIYERVLDGFCFTSEKKRLQPDERFGLTQRLIVKHFDQHFSSLQDKFAKNCVDMHTGDFDIIEVNRRDHIQWRITANGIEINVPSDLVSDCPKQYITHKNEF